jgi:hypothetical protein
MFSMCSTGICPIACSATSIWSIAVFAPAFPDRSSPASASLVSSIVMADVDGVARRSYLLAEWLIELRSPSEVAGTLRTWQEIADALVVAGVSRLAPYSE